MKIALHEIEPWLIQYQFARYNLAESGMANLTLGQLLEATGSPVSDLLKLSFDNTDTRGTLALRQAVAELYGGVDPESVLVTTGTSEGLFLYYQVRYTPGANVVVPTPAFQSLPEVPRYLGYEVRSLQLRPEQGFRLDLAELERLVDERTRIIVLNTPHNPTGMLPTAEEVAAVRRIAARVGAEVLADEHYRFVPYEGDHLLPSLYTPEGGVVAVGSMIKCLGCVGLRVGWLLGPRELLDGCRDLKDYTTHTLCSINDHLATQVLRNWRPLMKGFRQWVVQNVSRFGAFVKQHEELLGWVAPQAGIVAFPYLKDRSISTAHFCRRLVETQEVFVLPGETFEMPGHFRIGFGLPPDTFEAALERWSRFIEARGWMK
jgi:aspartate/methionine/tyrosine aminotransferase